MENGDMDVDQCLVGQFSSMGTTDRDVLVQQFAQLVGQQTGLDKNACEFFLEMSNWNLQAAIGAFYDYQSTNQLPGNVATNQPSMKFVQDVTIGEGESVPPETQFVKTWRIQNNGSEIWPYGCQLKFVNGEKLGACDQCHVRRISPGEHCDVSVNMTSPLQKGIYQGQWRMYTSNMQPFGDVIWVIITVEQGGLLGVTQQFSSFSTSHTNQQQFSNNNNNPFAQQDALMHDEPSQANHSSPFGHVAIPLPSASSNAFTCWNTKKSPTCDVEDELLNSKAHQLTSIQEEPDIKRQVSPSSSPNTRMQIESVLSSPLAPSPIRPTRQHSSDSCSSIKGKRLFE